METIYILLPVHNRKEVTIKFVACLNAQTYKNYHLILIDDGSKDGTEEMVRNNIAALTVLKGNGNWWWTGCLQQGYKWIREHSVPLSDVVLIINDDTEFDVAFLESAIRLLSRNNKTLILSQCLDRETGAVTETGVAADWRRLTFDIATAPHKINCLSTRGLFMRVSDLFEIGGFHARLLPHYASDYEFTMRARRRGMELITDPSLRLWFDKKTTGYRHFGTDPFCVFIKKLFSIKSVANPFVWTAFIALACPWKFKIINWLRVWKRTAAQITIFLMERAK